MNPSGNASGYEDDLQEYRLLWAIGNCDRGLRGARDLRVFGSSMNRPLGRSLRIPARESMPKKLRRPVVGAPNDAPTGSGSAAIDSDRPRTRRRGGSATVSIHVRELAQLFNSLDPSPFWDRDLDPVAAEFIEAEFRDKQSANVWHLHVHVHEGDTSPTHLQTAVGSYYGRLAHSARLALREHLLLGQLALLGGLAIFLLSMGTRGMLGRMLDPLPPILDEGLIILAWLALWRPAEALIYGWVPFYRNRRLFERLARIRVLVRLDAPPGAGLHPGAKSP